MWQTKTTPMSCALHAHTAVVACTAPVSAPASGRPADAPPIRFVGLFDTVASTGILPGKINLGVDLRLPPNVQKCCHAMALDESRASFHLERVQPRRTIAAD